MKKDHKVVFNLTIKDLKDLGILKKKKKRRKSKYNYKKKVAYDKFGEGPRTENLSKGQTIIDSTNATKNELVEYELKMRKE